MKFFLRLFALAFFLLIASCKDEPAAPETDNLFKFKEYISYHTQGRVSVAEPIRVDLAKPLEQYELTQEIPSEYVNISPKVNGKLLIENYRTLLFKPEKHLEPDTEYQITLKLEELYDDLKDEFKTYQFSFKTIQPNFKINLGNLQSYNREWQFVTGTLESSDVISPNNAKQILEASQGGKNLKIKWPEETNSTDYFRFTIDSIQRKTEDSEIEIVWNGKPIKAENEGKNTFPIPGRNNFKVIDLKTSLAERSSLSINFSDPLNENQDFKGLVTIKDQNNLRFEVDGNVLNVYPSNRITGETQVSVFKGIKNIYGFNLKKDLTESISFQQLKPGVRLISKGVVLPNSSNTPIYFETANLSAVDVRIIKIYEDNMLQFLQDGNLNNQRSYNLRRVGRRVAKKTISFKTNNEFELSSWKAHAINISDFIEADPGALYQVEISFKKAYSNYDCGSETTSEEQTEDDFERDNNNLTEEDELEEKYWDNELYNWRNRRYDWREKDNPCNAAYYREQQFASINILGSDLGFMVKESNNRSYHFATTNLLSAQPIFHGRRLLVILQGGF